MPEKNLTKGGLSPVTAWVEPRAKTGGDTVGNVSGLGHSGKDVEGSKGRIDTKHGTKARKPGKHTVPDVPKADKIPPVMTRSTPEHVATNPLKR